MISSGGTIVLKAHSGKHIDVEGNAVQARWNDQGTLQTLIIEKKGGGPINHGDTIFLTTHTGKHIDVEDNAVQSRWNDQGDWQKLIIEKKGGGPINHGDTIFLKAHTGKHIDVEGTAVQARWNDQGDWQKLIIESLSISSASKTAIQPAVNITAIQPAVNITAIQPAVNMTAIQPAVNMAAIQPIPQPTLMSTPLEVEFDRSIAGGVEFMKVKMKQMGQNGVIKNQRSATMEKESASLKEGYKIAIQSQNLMRRQIYEGEDRLEIIERDIKEIERRSYEKEEYLRELSIFKPGTSIEDAEKMDVKLMQSKQLYKENFDKFNKARQKKFTLETKQDMIDCTLRAVNSKVNALNSELHHLRLEDERKQEGNKRSAESAMFHSSGFKELDQNTQIMNQRMTDASRKMNALTMRVANKETEIRSMKFNRMDMENTVKNILRKVAENVARASLTSFGEE